MFRSFFAPLLVFVGLIVWPLAALADGNPNFDAARAKTKELVAQLKSYETTGSMSITRKVKGEAEGMEMEFLLHSAARWPDRLTSSQESPALILKFGVGEKQSWLYLGSLGTCYIGEPMELTRDLIPPGEKTLDSSRVFNFLGGLDPYLLGEDLEVEPETPNDNLVINGRPVTCQVFHYKPEPNSQLPPGQLAEISRTLWYDPQSGLILKSLQILSNMERGVEWEQRVTLTLTNYQIDEAVSEETFSFTPPEGVVIVDNFERLTNPDAMTGMKAPDVTFTDLAGEQIQLSSLRGKVVFLDFWATWCAPCRLEMPHIQKLYKELGTSGEVVFLAASSEGKSVIEKFLEKNPYTFPVVQVAAQDAIGKFKATSIPTGFVIDQEGIIRSHMVGVQNEAQLRAGLAKAGIE